MSEETKKGFRMPSSYTVLIIIIAVMAALTWIIPAGQYDVNKEGNLIAGTYKQVASNPQGIWDVLMAPIRAMLGHEPTKAAIDVSFFILMVGGFLGVVNETGTLDVGIASIVKKYKGREKMLIVILMPLFALGGTTYGMGEETMAFYPLLVPVMMAVGFDSITAVAIILLGSQIGCLASTLNPFATVIASDTAGVPTADGIVLRLIFWFVMVAMSTYFVYRYADKIQKDPTKSLVYSQREEDLKHFNVTDNDDAPSVLSKKQKHVLYLFIATFVIMVASFIPWTDLHINLFENFNSWLTGLPVIGKIIGSSTGALGTWYFPEGAMLFAFMGILVPEAYGGSALGYHEYITIISEISQVDPSIGLSIAAHNSLCVNHILSFANEEQKKRWLPKLASGEHIGAWGITEHNTGSDAGGMHTTAVKKGNQWVLNGTKNFITHAISADIAVVIARTGEKGDKHGMTAFVVASFSFTFAITSSFE